MNCLYVVPKLGFFPALSVLCVFDLQASSVPSRSQEKDFKYSQHTTEATSVNEISDVLL